MLFNERDGRMDAMMVIREMIHLQLSWLMFHFPLSYPFILFLSSVLSLLGPNLLTFYHLLKVFGKIGN